MKIASIAAIPRQAASPVVAVPKVDEGLGRTILDSADDFSLQGKKLGALGLVAAGTLAVPYMLAYSGVFNAPAAVAAGLGTMAALSLEEKHLGVGRFAGKLVGGAVGALVGVGKAGLDRLMPGEEKPEKVELPFREATGRPPREALLPSLIHRVERGTLGAVPKRDRAVEIGESIGATIGVLTCAYTLPQVIASALPYDSPITLMMQTLIGPLVGMVAGGLEENALGVGRAVGELAGQGVSALFGSKEGAAPKPADQQAQPSWLKQAFLHLNGVIAEPIIGPLVDVTVASNRIFTEKPYQSMQFQERPSPQVDRQRLLENFVQLAGINAPSGAEGPVSDELERQVAELGFDVERRPDNTILATRAASPGMEDAPTVMLSGHQDTVHATSAEAIRVDHRKIATDGTHILGADDRAGIAEILEGVRVVVEQDLPHPELKLVFPVDEERGLVGSSRLAPDDISTRPTLGFVVDALSLRDVHLTNDAVIVNTRSVKYQFSQEDPLVQVVFRSMTNAGLKPRPIHAPIMVGAGSDANTPGFNTGQIRSLAVGAGEADMHSTLEHIKIDDLEQAARHVVGYITNSCDLKVEGDQIVPRFQAPQQA